MYCIAEQTAVSSRSFSAQLFKTFIECILSGIIWTDPENKSLSLSIGWTFGKLVKWTGQYLLRV